MIRSLAIDVRGRVASLAPARRTRDLLGAFGGNRADVRSAGAPDPRPRRARSLVILRIATVLVGAVVVAAVVFLFVFPTAQWNDQRNRIADTRAQVEQAESEIDALEGRIADLEDPRTIEYIARERFGFVRPDEAAFRLQAPPVDAATFPDAWPWRGFSHLVNGG